MNTSISSWSVVGFISVTTGLSFLAACSSSDSAKPAASVEAGAETGGKGGASGKSTGGAKSTAGSTSGGGGTTAVDAASTCTAPVDVTCDGPEDCPAGQRCCGQWNQEYQKFGCFDSCIAQQVDAGMALWFDLCHPGDTCEDSTATCLTSMYLPSSLSRCYNTGNPPDPKLAAGKGEINCGADVCGAGEKCCMRGATLTPYCAPSAATCECTKPQGTKDAGKGSGGAASVPDAASPADAASHD